MKISIVFVALFVTSVTFAGGGSSIGPANPASTNCLKLGGDLEMVTTPAGQYGNCVIEEWTLFTAMNERGLVKPHQYPGNSMPNPAAVNCLDINGQLRYSKQVGACVVEEWALFHIINVLK